MTEKPTIMTEKPTTVDPDEVARFSAMAAEWWNPRGKFGVLHKFNPIRLNYIKTHICHIFKRDILDPNALKGLRLLDIGCGGGLLCEPMARLGADVVGVDPSLTNIKTAALHASEQKLPIDYRTTTAEDLAETNETFDIVLNMEVVEHVADMPLFVQTCASMVRPGGIMMIATINRTLKAWGMAIIGAEYILGWLPRGTHAYEKLIRPDELKKALVPTGMNIIDKTGVVFDPLHGSWKISQDMNVNYMIATQKPK